MEVLVGRTYRHFKGKEYVVIAIAYDSDTLEKKVVYQALYGEGKIWVRDYSEFISSVDINKYPDMANQSRFTLCD